MIGSKKYQLSEDAMHFYKQTINHIDKLKYKHIVNPCLTKDTWILTDNGPRQIVDLIGKQFIAIVNNDKYNSTEDGFFSSGVKQIYKITTDRGQEIKLTDNHKLLVELKRRHKFNSNDFNFDLEYKETKNLKIGDKLVLHNHFGNSWNGYGSFDQGWLLGEIVGDGFFNPGVSVTSLCFWGKDARTMQMLAESICIENHPNVRSDFGQRDFHGDRLEVSTNKLDDFVGRFILPLSKDFLPSLEKETSSKFIRGFIRGLFDADGTVAFHKSKGSSIRLAQSNLETLLSVQRMLARLGIIGTVYKFRRVEQERLLPNGKGGQSFYNCKAQHELVISRDNIERYAHLIGFYDSAKQEKLDNILDSRKKEVYRDTYLTKVESIELIGEEEVFDCTIPEVHCFDANGFISHNCGEASLKQTGAYCVLSDLAPFFANSLGDVLEAGEIAARFLIRTNLMDSIYHTEVKRTNRIGVSLTGIHEFAWKFFGYGFYDLLDETNAQDFWKFLALLRKTIEDAGREYSIKLGVNSPHTFTTMKPSGSISKLFGVTEGAHLPEHRHYIRWTQFQNGDPLIEKYKQDGYPVRELTTYPNVSIVGFPMQPFITTLGMGDKLVLANEVSPEDHYKWVSLLEKYWLGEGTNQQISYTIMLNTDKYSLEEFRDIVANNQGNVRCCSILPTISDEMLSTLYEYLPNEEISKERYDEIVSSINFYAQMQMMISSEDMQCAGGACPL